MAVREAEPVGSLQEVKDAGLDREDLLGIYRSLLITRGIEERGHILYKQGKTEFASCYRFKCKYGHKLQKPAR